MTNLNQKGFTLIELMIAMTLGLLIVAAALGVFLSGQRSLATQTGMDDLQQNSIFGLSQLTHELRHTNLNTSRSTNQAVTKTGEGSGVIFSDDNRRKDISSNISADNFANAIDDRFLTRTETGRNPIFTNISNDQLTIQFKPHEADLLTSCTGRSLDRDEFNAQRYFVQAMPNTSNPVRYGLYCDANNSEETFGSGERLLIPDVEAFKVRFNTKQGNDFKYMNIGEILSSTNNDEIISIEIGLVMRSTHNLGSAGEFVNNNATYTIAGTRATLDPNSTSNQPRHLREAFSQVVAIRNSSGG